MDDGEIDFGGCEGDIEMCCNSCGKDYFLSRQVTFYYSSSKLENT